MVFAPAWSQVILLQYFCVRMRLLQFSPRYWRGADGNLILEEWGRRRPQHALEWLLEYGFDSALACICMKFPDLLGSVITGSG